MARVFSRRSLKNLEGMHPDLVRVVRRALELSAVDFTVVEDVRSLARQKKLLGAGASRTLKSWHLVQDDGYGHAVDLYPYYNRSVQVHAPFQYFRQIAEAMKAAAAELGIGIGWGGDWKSFCDGPHYQLEPAA
jgi:peptidoglycan L-alanyl-D-glutamate endopeptidase CwlK